MDEYGLWKDLAEVLHRHGLTIVSHERRHLAAGRFSARKARVRITLEAEA